MRFFLIFSIASIWSISSQVSAQNYDFTYNTFKDTRVINVHSVETLAKRKLDVRISHRFGNVKDGWESLYGLENAVDVMIGAEYGVTDDFNIGIYRTKGAGPLRQLLNGFAKYRVLKQAKDKGMPFSLTALAVGTYSTMESSELENVLNNFQEDAHRLSYTYQLMIARKFSDFFSLQLAPGLTHRNLVDFNDENNLFSLGVASRIQISKVFGLILDGNFTFSDLRTNDNNYYPALGVGLEIDTGGHVFQINLTNATGISENDYIPYTQSNWADGEFRLGFTISRLFNL